MVHQTLDMGDREMSNQAGTHPSSLVGVMNNPNAIANLKPFKPGHTSPLASAAKLRALTRARLASPEMVDIAVAIAKDVEDPSMVRLKAVESRFRVALPAKSLVVEELTERPGTRLLDVVFIDRSQDEAARRAAEQVEAKPDARGRFAVPFQDRVVRARLGSSDRPSETS